VAPGNIKGGPRKQDRDGGCDDIVESGDGGGDKSSLSGFGGSGSALSGLFGGKNTSSIISARMADCTLILSSEQEEAKEGGASQKSVPNCCAICLSSYKVGEAVVWSTNEDCPHAFHQNCIVDYLVTVNGGKTPCPCCRQNFVCELSEKESPENKT
jgi:hypothetical protein